MENKDNISTILKFMPESQAMCFIARLNGAEQEHFKRIANKIAGIIENAPAIYETDSKGDKVKPVLHYFYGNVDIYITELDKSGNNQHFGYTSLGMGYLEAGYIDLNYIFSEIPALNLDLNFTPKTIANYKRKYEG